MDDEKALVEIYEKVLEMRGIPICFVAYDGEEALRKLAEHNPKPQIILMDYRMPIMNGIEAMRRIFRLEPEAKVIFISADGSVKEAALEAGAACFIQKPASIKEIIKAVETVAAT
ncbi:MAG: response regulator transcription factor [Methanocella sp.]